VIPDRVNLATDEATVFITDIYQGPGLQGVPRGAVKELRIIEYYFSRRSFGGLYGTLGLDGPWDVKRILGTVPVEADGSAHFRIPANSPLSLQPLDEKGQALQLMRSWFVGMPGEAISCAGCHEPRNEVSLNRPSLASRHQPSPIEPWYGPARGFSFVREVQPVLDQHCVSCHDGTSTEHPDFRGGRPLTDWSSQLAGRWTGGGSFTESYFQLQRFVRRNGIEGDRRMLTPLEFHFGTTELGQILSKGHQGVTLDHEAWDRFVTWADLNAPFYGTWGEIPQFREGQPGGKQLASVNRRATELRLKYVPSGPHPDYEAIPEIPKFATKPRKVPVGLQLEAPDARVSCDGWPFDATAAIEKQQAAVPGSGNLHLLDLGDGVKLELVRVPAGRFVMAGGGNGTDKPPAAVVDVEAFWMARFETANRQLRQFMPEHDSRTEDRHGYQFGRLGYDVNQPDQPAVRVSWDEAMAFCRWLSEKSGLRVSLPTEAEWEWACRAGSDRPFWFGGLEADYSSFANLGDKTLAEFAADTALDNYSAARPMVNPNRYDDWIPRDNRFSDGGLVTAPVGRYKPNPWGLHDMHGNAAEWTLGSDGGLKVVRGGSWYERPHRCTAASRQGYPAWQRVFNVGFRVACKEKAPVQQAAVSGGSSGPRP